MHTSVVLVLNVSWSHLVSNEVVELLFVQMLTLLVLEDKLEVALLDLFREE